MHRLLDAGTRGVWPGKHRLPNLHQTQLPCKRDVIRSRLAAPADFLRNAKILCLVRDESDLSNLDLDNRMELTPQQLLKVAIYIEKPWQEMILKTLEALQIATKAFWV